MRILALLLVVARSACAQSIPIVFEAASIKPFPEGTTISFSGCTGGPGSNDPGSIRCEYVTLKMLLMRAYQVKSQEIFGPGWLDSAHFSIAAKVPAGTSKDQVPAMFQALLSERFKVALHHETRAIPAYSVTVAKGGLKIREYVPEAGSGANDTQPPGGPPPTGKDGFPILRPAVLASGPIILYRQGRARLQARGTTLARLAEALSQQLDRIVVDETGASAKYDITLTWTPDSTELGGTPHGPDRGTIPESSTPEPTIFMAMEQQLGLRLAPKKVERKTLVVDRAEKVPTEN